MKQALLFLSLLFSLTVSAQMKTLRYRATGFAFTTFRYEKTHDEFLPVDILIIAYLSTGQIKFYNKDMDVFDIISDSETKDGSTSVFKYDCVDKEGRECFVSFMDWPEANPEWCVIVQYKDNTYVYKLEVVKD